MKKNKFKNINLPIAMSAILFATQAVIVFLLLPLYTAFISNTVFTVAADVVRIFIDIFDIAVMAIGFTFISVAFFMDIPKKYKFAVIYISVSLFRQVGSMCMSLLINRTLGSDEIYMAISVFLLDMVLLVCASLVSGLLSKKYIRSYANTKPNSVLLGETSEKCTANSLYPFKKLYSHSNLLQRNLLTVGALLSCTRIISRLLALIYDTPNTIWIYVLQYVSDIFIAVISYAISCLILSILYSRNEKRRAISKLYGDGDKN